MADGVEYTDEDYRVARTGLFTQLVASNYFDSNIPTGYAINNFIDNTAEVIAYERAYSRMLQNALHEMSGVI